VDWLHSIGNTSGCKCQFLIDSEFGRSTNRYTRSPDNFLTHFNSNRSLGLQPLAAMRLTREMDWGTGRGDSARRCPPQERTAGFVTVDSGRQVRPGFNRLQEATGRAQRFRKARSNDRWAADLATVASVEEAGASWKRSWEGGNRWKLRGRLIFRVGRNTAPQRHRDAGKGDQTPRRASAAGSTGIRREGEEPVGEALGQLVKGVTFSAGMTEDLAVIA
jgi:hypothetical protein